MISLACLILPSHLLYYSLHSFTRIPLDCLLTKLQQRYWPQMVYNSEINYINLPFLRNILSGKAGLIEHSLSLIMYPRPSLNFLLRFITKIIFNSNVKSDVSCTVKSFLLSLSYLAHMSNLFSTLHISIWYISRFAILIQDGTNKHYFRLILSFYKCFFKSCYSLVKEKSCMNSVTWLLR